MRRSIRWLAIVVSLALAIPAALLAWTHGSIRRAGAPLPTVGEIRALPMPADAPVEVLAVDTATQAMPRALVLEASLDPTPNGEYRMSHPAFLLRWADGRGLLVDLGMDPDAARGFGAAGEWVGAAPIRTHGSAAELLARWLPVGPLSVLFSHLHSDHVQGVGALCKGRSDGELSLYQTRRQQGRGNYTTWPGRRLLDAVSCLAPEALADERLAPVPGHPGVSVFSAGGHTPGTQVVIAQVRDRDRSRLVVFSGDVVNHVDGIRHDVPKPDLYRLLVTPEADARLGEVRRLLAALESELGAEIAVAHDRFQLESLGLLSPSSTRAGWPEALRIRGGADGGAAIARDALERILSTRIGSRARERLASDSLPGPITIAIDGSGDNLTWYRVPGREPGETIAFDPSNLPLIETEAGPLRATAETVLAHELGHALFKLQTEEAVIVEVENPVRAELGLPKRSVF
jgi:glyoxylase-like metal-dependent hydrolase (beta-lactamase superfamily II)